MVEYPNEMDGTNIAPRTEIPHEGLYPPQAKEIHTGKTFGHRFTREQFNEASQWVGFSESPISSGVGIGQWSEYEIAEAIFDWWISGKPYKQWYADKYLQQKINFEQDENQQSI